MTDKKIDSTDETGTTVVARRRRPRPNVSVNAVRTVLAQVVWLVCVVFALVLAVAVLLIAINANSDNALVRFIGDFAARVDLHFFDLHNPVKDFDTSKKPADDVKTALFNYGVCAVIWLAAGRILERIIRPSSVKKK